MRRSTIRLIGKFPSSKRKTAVWIIAVFLAIEFLDEYVYGLREAALPLIRDDLGMSYAQVGLLLGVPGLVSAVLEPVIGILADTGNAGKRTHVLVLAGGIVFAFSLLLSTIAQRFGWLLASYAMFYPASGAFITLSQSQLMTLQPEKQEQNMARWTFAGSAGVLLGTLTIAIASHFNVSWRWFFAGSAVMTVLVLLLTRRQGQVLSENSSGTSFWQGVKQSLRYLKNWQVSRWLVFLQVSDLLVSVFISYTSLFFMDVLGVTMQMAASSVMVATSVAMLGDFLIIGLLKRVSGIGYLRITAWVQLLLLPVYFLTSGYWLHLGLLVLITLFCAGWYAILKAQLYAALPDQGGIVMALNNIAGLVGALLPWVIGQVAEVWGLRAGMWLIMLAPITIILGLPRNPAPKLSESGF